MRLEADDGLWRDGMSEISEVARFGGTENDFSGEHGRESVS